jgi:DNA helicase-2/ATP-dependent DNA helicase PcrA
LAQANRVKRKNIDNYKENELNKGDKVNHAKFGDGVVISVVNDNCMIAFAAPYGVKTLLKNHKAINKI